MQAQQFHVVTHSFAQRQVNISIAFNLLRTLSIATGVVPSGLVVVAGAGEFADDVAYDVFGVAE